MQPCMSPVWDAAYAMFALGEAGVPANDPRMVKCADWILQKQVRNRRRLESEEQRRASRAAGTSNSTTSFIPMWMTAPWFAWR
jgi:squalene cyclase